MNKQNQELNALKKSNRIFFAFLAVGVFFLGILLMDRTINLATYIFVSFLIIIYLYINYIKLEKVNRYRMVLRLEEEILNLEKKDKSFEEETSLKTRKYRLFETRNEFKKSANVVAGIYVAQMFLSIFDSISLMITSSIAFVIFVGIVFDKLLCEEDEEFSRIEQHY